MDKREAMVHTTDRVVPIEFSDTGDFRLTREELKAIILRHLAKRKSGALKQRALFGSVLHTAGLNPRGEKREAILKVFLAVLREMRDSGKVEFRSGRTAVFVALT